MKEKNVTPPTPKAITQAIQRLEQQVHKRLSVKYIKETTKQSLLQNVDSLYTIINNIYTALGMKPCSPSIETKSTKEQLNKIESIVVDMSKLCFEHFERQATQSTVKRTIIHEEITENEESESTASVETETSSYKSQFVKSFGNRIFEAQKQANKNDSEFKCIKELLTLLNDYVYKRFRKQYPELGMYHYSLEQIKQFTTIVILKYAVEYSHNPYSAKKFKEEMNGWIDRIGKDKEVTVKESLPKCLHKFDTERDVQITPTVMYIWWLLCDELKNAKRTKNETIDFDELFDYEYIDSLAEKINPDVYYNCPYPASHDEISNYLD